MVDLQEWTRGSALPRRRPPAGLGREDPRHEQSVVRRVDVAHRGDHIDGDGLGVARLPGGTAPYTIKLRRHRRAGRCIRPARAGIPARTTCVTICSTDNIPALCDGDVARQTPIILARYNWLQS